MKISKILMTVIAVFALIATANTAYAQESATVSGTGTVLEPVTITGTNLSFGTSIFPGRDEVVAIQDAGAAQFDLDGETSKEVTLTFSTLPTALVHDTDGGTELPISYSNADAGHHPSDAPGSATTFDPSVGTTTSLGTTDGLLYVYLGGTASPASSQKQGAYSADITLEVAYTGN